MADDGTKDDGIVKSHMYVTFHTRMPAVLIETAFLSNPNDYALLTSPSWRQKSPKKWRTASCSTRGASGRRPIGASRSRDRSFRFGPGGLTVLARVRERMPSVDVLFFADQAHVPYGDRTHAELLELLRANLARLEDDGVDAIVMACNTSCAVAERYGWPPTRAPIVDLIESAAIAVSKEGFSRIGVVATAATVGAGSYGRTIRARIPGVDVVEVAAPALVPLVEAGKHRRRRSARRGRRGLLAFAARSRRGRLRLHALSDARTALSRGARRRRRTGRSRGRPGAARGRTVGRTRRAARGRYDATSRPVTRRVSSPVSSACS